MRFRALKDFSLPGGVTFKKGTEFYAYEYEYHDLVNCRCLDDGAFYIIDRKTLEEMEPLET